MLKKILIITAIMFLAKQHFSQGNIEHIKDQEYLKYKDKVDCNHKAGDNLTERICANIAFQRSDSLLTLVYDSLLMVSNDHHIDSLKFKIMIMQKQWQSMRDEHCKIIYDDYQDCGGCHVRSIAYLFCMRELTDNRIFELRKLLLQLSGK